MVDSDKSHAAKTIAEWPSLVEKKKKTSYVSGNVLTTWTFSNQKNKKINNNIIKKKTLGW